MVAAEAMANHKAAAAHARRRITGKDDDEVDGLAICDRHGPGDEDGGPRQPPTVAAHGLIVDELLRLDVAHTERAGQGDGLVGPDWFVRVQRVVEGTVVADADHRLALKLQRVPSDAQRAAQYDQGIVPFPGCGRLVHPLGQLFSLRHQLRLGLLDAVEVGQAESGQAREHQSADDHGHHGQAQASAHKLPLPEPVAHAPDGAER